MAITQNQRDGTPIFLKDSAWASNYFGGAEMLNQPKRKFLFFCGFIGNPLAMKPEFAAELMTNKYIFMSKGMKPPSFSIETEVLNQYNRKRIVQTGVTYDTITLRVHDDVDNKMSQLMYEYMRYTNKDFSNTNKEDWVSDVVKPDFKQSENWGMNLHADKQFFSGMWLAWVNSGRVTYAIIHNPLISKIDFDDLDYTDSELAEISITLDYEGVVFKDLNTNLESFSGEAIDLYNAILETESIGMPGEGPSTASAGSIAVNRSPGLGEIFNTFNTFFGKYNGSPTLSDAVGDFFLRPILGELSNSLSSWGNFNIGELGGGDLGALGAVGDVAGDALQYLNSGTVVTDIFKASTGSLGDTRANDLILQTTGLFGKLF